MARVIFMGTPEFAVPILASLAQQYNIVAVYTRADKPAGRGKKLVESAVKVAARELGLVVEQPRSLKNENVMADLRAYRPDVIVVAAYGLILPQAVIDIPPHGCINTHASLLPRWRGASPIAHAILAGDSESGITLMQMDAGLDTGPIIRMRAAPIEETDTTGALTGKLSHLAASLLKETLTEWMQGTLVPLPQPATGATSAPLIRKTDGLINWNRPAAEIERAVRAYNPWPSAFTFLQSPKDGDTLLLKVWGAGVDKQEAGKPPGTVLVKGDQVEVATGDGTLILRQVQLAGKRVMDMKEFALGRRDFLGSRLGSTYG